MNVVRGEEDRAVDRRELVDPAANHPPELLPRKISSCMAGAALVAVLAVRGQRDVKTVVPEVAAVTQGVPGADGLQIAGLEVERLGVERQRDRKAIGTDGEDWRRRRSAGW